MSNIYINEPPTDGKVLLKTTVGEIDIELWSKETPKTCRNFIQLCLEGYYDNTIFHRVVKKFIVQGGDPTGTGMGGESIYGEPFKDEFHTRLRFIRRGLVAMANAGPNDNASQFFFTLAAAQELQNKHTVFGKIAGKTLYNMLKLEDAQVDQNDKPLYPQKILSTEVLSNPFPDIVPRVTKKATEQVAEKIREKGKKDYKLLSFGDEAEEDEEEVNVIVKDEGRKSKSSHDILKNDPKLSSVPVVETVKRKANEVDSEEDEKKSSKRLEKIKKKLKKKAMEANDDDDESKKAEAANEEVIFDYNMDYLDEKREQEKAKLEETRREFKLLKKQMAAERKKDDDVETEKESTNVAVVEFRKESEKYKEATNTFPRKDKKMREEQCLALLDKFRSRLSNTREKLGENPETENEVGPPVDPDDWMVHHLKCHKEDEIPVLAKDANERGNVGWFDLFDPRNPINIRRREGAPMSGNKS